MSSRVAQIAGRRVGVWILSFVQIDSDESGGEKTLFPEEVRLMPEASGED